ncbi:MAG: helix-turn-helix transcriptional regulator, partial [Gammaproteobacteria bacterium]|nr:helix-turn-helix transcriptional regulator [Gammaproteobacteria bacterium]
MDKKLPYGNILTPQGLGLAVRAYRRAQGMTQADLAGLCGVGTRFISDLENGKPTIALGKALQVMQCLGMELALKPRGWP